MFHISDFEKYDVSEDGIVYNKRRKPVRRKWVGNNIYVQILNNDSKPKTVRVDKLVYQTYVQNPTCEYELEHIDGKQANCKLENLLYKPLDK